MFLELIAAAPISDFLKHWSFVCSHLKPTLCALCVGGMETVKTTCAVSLSNWSIIRFCQWVVFKKKFNGGNFKDINGFIQPFLNPAASHLADRKELWGAVQDERLLYAEWSKNKEVITSRSRLVVARSLSFGG